MRRAAITLFFSVAALTALGMVMLVSASTGHKEATYLMMQPLWCVLGLIACWAAAALDYRIFKRHPWLTWALFLVVLALLVLVLIPGIGFRIKGSSRWLKLGPFTMQPSELAKIALVLVLALYAEREAARFDMPSRIFQSCESSQDFFQLFGFATLIFSQSFIGKPSQFILRLGKSFIPLLFGCQVIKQHLSEQILSLLRKFRGFNEGFLK